MFFSMEIWLGCATGKKDSTSKPITPTVCLIQGRQSRAHFTLHHNRERHTGARHSVANLLPICGRVEKKERVKSELELTIQNPHWQ